MCSLRVNLTIINTYKKLYGYKKGKRMTVEEFKLIITKQLKDPSSALYYYLSNGKDISQDQENNLVPRKTSLYASEFGLRIDFSYNKKIAKERRGTPQSSNPVGYYDILFVEAPRKGELDISGWDHDYYFAEEKIAFGLNSIQFGINYYEAAHENYEFFKDDHSLSDKSELFDTGNFEFTTSPLSFTGDIQGAMKEVERLSNPGTSDTPYLYYRFSESDMKELKRILRNSPVSCAQVGSLLSAMGKLSPCGKTRGIKAIYECIEDVIDSTEKV